MSIIVLNFQHVWSLPSSFRKYIKTLTVMLLTKKMSCKFCKNSFIFVFLANHFQLIDRLCLPWFQSIMVNQATQQSTKTYKHTNYNIE